MNNEAVYVSDNDMEPDWSQFDAFPNGELFVHTLDQSVHALEVLNKKYMKIMFKCVICYQPEVLETKWAKVHRCGQCKKCYCNDCAHKVGYSAKKCALCRGKWNDYIKRN